MCAIYRFTNWIGRFFPQLLLRLVVAWQAWDAGLLMQQASEKTFAAQGLPPFSWMQTAWIPDLSFSIVMWWQLVGALFVLIGFRTRIVVLGLIILTVATLFSMLQLDGGTFAEFWRSTDRGDIQEKMLLLYLVILVALFFLGSGRLSVDAITGWFGCGNYARKARKTRKTKQKVKAKEKKQLRKQKKLDKKVSKVAAENQVAKEPVANESSAKPRQRKIKVKENIDAIKEPTPE